MNLILLFVWSASGIYSITRGLKVKGSRVCVLYMILASCAFIFALGTLATMFLSPGPLKRFVLAIMGIDIGVWLGIFLAMRITGNFVQNKDESETSRPQQ